MSKANDELRKLMEEHRPEIERLKRWGKFFELNPQFCPHNGVTAPVAKDGTDLLGICLACGKDGITSDMQGEYPEGDITVEYTSTGTTVSTAVKWDLKPL